MDYHPEIGTPTVIALSAIWRNTNKLAALLPDEMQSVMRASLANLGHIEAKALLD